MRAPSTPWTTALVALLAALAPSGRTLWNPPRPPEQHTEDVLEASRVPRQPTAQAQLAYAKRAKQALAGTRGRERMQRRWEAAAAYAAVRVHHAEEPCLGAEGAFRAGELLRGGGDLHEALREFRAARSRCPQGPFHARSVLEIGHVERRLGRDGEALDAYQELYTDARVAPAVRDRAMSWAGRVHDEAGRFDAARRLWERVARTAEDPVERVRAYDLLALALIERGDLEGAAGVLESCRGALRDVASEETQSGARVRGALTQMRAVESLRKSVVRRREGVRIDAAEGR